RIGYHNIGLAQIAHEAVAKVAQGACQFALGPDARIGWAYQLVCEGVEAMAVLGDDLALHIANYQLERDGAAACEVWHVEADIAKLADGAGLAVDAVQAAA